MSINGNTINFNEYRNGYYSDITNVYISNTTTTNNGNFSNKYFNMDNLKESYIGGTK